ncbi:hypothetical protein PG985_014765 [Apiospora marii]|uniref:uncharacterized protein n=1 Tax=Apiospora marii TaxID=335849 RepID=UPI0031320875
MNTRQPGVSSIQLSSTPPSERQVANHVRILYDHDQKLVDLWDWRYLYSYLHLLRPSELPLVPVVNHFDTWPTTRKLYDRVAIDIPARLPGLQEAEWELNDWEIRFIGLRRAHRHDLAQAVAETLPRSSNLRSLILVMKGTASFWVPDFSVGNLNMGDCQDFDVLSDAIRAATSGISALRYLRVCGVVDGSLFWPGAASAAKEPYWQNLEHLSVNFDARRPSGGGYFRDPVRRELNIPSEAEIPPGYEESGGVHTATVDEPF